MYFMTRIQDEKPDVVGITEISPKNGKAIEAPEINIRGYVIFYDLASRGMCLYIKEKLNPLQVNFNSSTRCILFNSTSRK